MDKLLAGVLIVKNEEHSIEKTLKSLHDHCDEIVVVDTGSTDKTVEIAEKYALVIKSDFTTYADTRNHALFLATQRAPTVFTLTMSSDEVLVGGTELRSWLEQHRDDGEHVAYCVLMRTDNRQWPFPRVLRSGAGCKYVNSAGRRHEQPVDAEGRMLTVENAPGMPGVMVIHEESDPERKLRRLREVDLPDLTREVEDESRAVTDRMEAMYQLAETHFILGHKDRDPDGNREVGGKWWSHLFSAMAMYNRFADIADHVGTKMKEAGEDNAKFVLQRAMQARLMFLYVAETFGLFEPKEMVKRLNAIATLAPNLPEAHWLLAKNVAYVTPAEAIPLCMKAAKVARAVYERPVLGPVDATLEWQAYRLAAECANAIKDYRLMKDFAKRSLACGAPRELISVYLSEEVSS